MGFQVEIGERKSLKTNSYGKILDFFCGSCLFISFGGFFCVGLLEFLWVWDVFGRGDVGFFLSSYVNT